MSLTQFAMVEELASLIRDNLPCKHLVLSVEEALLNFLQDDNSSDGVLELEPMNSYNRLLLHRLADIFGFSHESVGEGDERHLVLERCPETSIPSILVSDLLWQYDELQTPKFLEVLKKKKEDPAGLSPETQNCELSFEEREAAYLAARERIFSTDECGSRELVKQRPQHNPIVARRMIAHALGHRIKPSNNSEVHGEQANNVKIQHDEGPFNLSVHANMDGNVMPDKHLNSSAKTEVSKVRDNESSNSEIKIPQEKIDKSNKFSSTGTERNEIKIQKNNFRGEHMGAAKRMFANALGFHTRNGNFSRSSQNK